MLQGLGKVKKEGQTQSSHGRGHNQGRGHGRGRGCGKESDESANDGEKKTKIQCYGFQSYRHFAFESHNEKIKKDKEEKSKSEKLEDKEESSLLMAILDEINDILLQGLCGDISKDSWYLDKGSSSRMIGIKNTNYQDEKKNGIVRFGDGSFVNHEGKGKILVHCKDIIFLQ